MVEGDYARFGRAKTVTDQKEREDYSMGTFGAQCIASAALGAADGLELTKLFGIVAYLTSVLASIVVGFLYLNSKKTKQRGEVSFAGMDVFVILLGSLFAQWGYLVANMVFGALLAIA